MGFYRTVYKLSSKNEVIFTIFRINSIEMSFIFTDEMDVKWALYDQEGELLSVCDSLLASQCDLLNLLHISAEELLNGKITSRLSDETYTINSMTYHIMEVHSDEEIENPQGIV